MIKKLKKFETYNVKIPFLRPKKLSGDKSPAQLSLKHATIFRKN